MGSTSKACLIVQDTGPGIPREDLPQIFDKFFKPRSSSGDTLSTGLGLGLCRWIAEAHQGYISVHSEQGKGAEFVVQLPLIEESSSNINLHK